MEEDGMMEGFEKQSQEGTVIVPRRKSHDGQQPRCALQKLLDRALADEESSTGSYLLLSSEENPLRGAIAEPFPPEQQLEEPSSPLDFTMTNSVVGDVGTPGVVRGNDTISSSSIGAISNRMNTTPFAYWQGSTSTLTIQPPPGGTTGSLFSSLPFAPPAEAVHQPSQIEEEEASSTLFSAGSSPAMEAPQGLAQLWSTGPSAAPMSSSSRLNQMDQMLPHPPQNSPMVSSSSSSCLMAMNLRHNHQDYHSHMTKQPGRPVATAAGTSISSLLMTSDPGSIRAWMGANNTNNNNFASAMSSSSLSTPPPYLPTPMPNFTSSATSPVSPSLQSSNLQLQHQEQLRMRQRELQLVQQQEKITKQLHSLQQIQQLQQLQQQQQGQQLLPMRPLVASDTGPLGYHGVLQRSNPSCSNFNLNERGQVEHGYNPCQGQVAGPSSSTTSMTFSAAASTDATCSIMPCSSSSSMDPRCLVLLHSSSSSSPSPIILSNCGQGGVDMKCGPIKISFTTTKSPVHTKGHWKKDPATAFAFLKKRDKNKNKPKRPLSAYNLFFKDERAKMVAAARQHHHHRGGADHDQTMTLAEENSSSSKTNDDNNESRMSPPIADKTMSTSSTSSSTSTTTKSVKQKSGAAFVTMAQTVATQWKSIDDQVLAKYKEMAASDKERYDREMQVYRAQQEQELQKELQQQQRHEELEEEQEE